MAFKSINIQNFRGIQNCQISNLKQINLFVGKNNCGKTSVLDALFLLTSMSNPESLIRINSFRNFLTKDWNNLLSNLFYALNLSNKISIKSDELDSNKRELFILPSYTQSENIQINISDIVGEPLSNKTKQDFEKLIFKFSYSNAAYEASIEPDKSKKDIEYPSFSINKPKKYKENITCNYLNSRDSFSFYKDTLASIIENKEKESIISALQDIEPTLKDIQFSADNNVLVDLGFEKLLPIQVLGDGIRRLFAIILSIIQCKNGIVLIDEIDNGLHYSSMPILWKTILSVADKYNVQIFATTHNIDSLQTLKTVLEREDYAKLQSNTTCYNLTRLSNNLLKSYQYDFNKFQFAIDAQNEIR